MTWVKLDDGFISHPKTLKISHKSIVLHIAGLCYCSAQLTDGTIPAAAIPRLLGEARCTKKSVAELVDVGMWREQGKDYIIHDFLEYQESREKVLDRRSKAAERKRKSRRDSQRDYQRESQHPSRDTRPDPTRPDLEDTLISERVQQIPVDKSMKKNVIDAEVAARRRASSTPIANPERWSAKVSSDIETEHGADIDRLIAKYPEAPYDVIQAAAIHNETRSLAHYQPTNEGDAA